MAYEKQTWQTGDVVTSAKLNHMEDGIAGAGGGTLVVHDDGSGTLDKTWKEVADAGFAVLQADSIVTVLAQVTTGGAQNPWALVFLNLSTQQPLVFTTDSENGYPVYTATPGS